MKIKAILLVALLVIIAGLTELLAAAEAPLPISLSIDSLDIVSSPPADDPSPPADPIKLIFIHHSTGGNWLADPSMEYPSGGLGQALMNNNYFVSATNYGWGPDSIGDLTDIPNWPEWFTGPNSSTYLSALYAETGQNFGDFGSWSRLDTDPGGENEIIMFKSCFPNSDLYGQPNDPPASEPNDQYTVSNAKAVYNNLLTYFETRQDKLFIVITAPPMGEGEYSPGDPSPAQRAANARAFNNWLVNDWLAGYPYSNVAVFDYYNVLTSNGSATRVDDPDPDRNDEPNDEGWSDGNHHRWTGSAIEHIQTISNNYSAYPTHSTWDSHPTSAGHRKAAAEFVPLLNVFYNRWKSGTAAPAAPPAEATQTPAPFTPTSPPPTEEAAAPPPAAEEATEPPPPIGPPPAAGVIDDLESGAEGWEADAETDSSIACEPDSGTAHGGETSLRIDYDIALSAWGYCGRYFESTENWSDSTGLSLWLYSEEAGQNFTLMLFSGDPEGPTPFEAYVESGEGWTQLVLPWSSFVRAEWADASGLDEVDPTRVTGLGFSFDAPEAPKTNTLWVDDISLATGEEPSPPEPTAAPTAEPVTPTEEPPTAPTEEPSPVPPTEEPAKEQPSPVPPIEEPKEEEPAPAPATDEPKEESGGGGGLCGTTILPLGMVAVLLIRKRR